MTKGIAEIQCKICGKWLPIKPPVWCCGHLILAKIVAAQPRCQRCGYFYSEVWQTTDALWQKVTGITDGSGLFCASCFSIMAAARGMALKWECGEEINTQKHSKTTPRIILKKLSKRPMRRTPRKPKGMKIIRLELDG